MKYILVFVLSLIMALYVGCTQFKVPLINVQNSQNVPSSGDGTFPPCTSSLCPTGTGLVSYTTTQSAGFEWTISGDTNHNAAVSVLYRAQGESTWKSGLPFIRLDATISDSWGNYSTGNKLSGSLFFLNPSTAYDVKLTLTDPDGGGEIKNITVVTKAWPQKPQGGRTFHVIPGGGGGDGTAANPFKGIKAGDDIARPGDTFLLHAGTYTNGGNEIEFHASGAPGNYIVWQAFGDGAVMLHEPNSDTVNTNAVHLFASYVWFEDLTIQDMGWAIWVGSESDGVVVKHCQFLRNHYGIDMRGRTQGWFIIDNTFTGQRQPSDWNSATDPSTMFDGEALELDWTNDHVIAFNSISHTADGTSDPGTNVDYFSNDVFDLSDDLFETDGGMSNVRVWGNRFTNGNNGFSFQPQKGGPWYFIRNQLMGIREGWMKQKQVMGAVLLNNTIASYKITLNDNRGSWGSEEDGFFRHFTRNNLFVTASDAQIFSMSNLAFIDWRANQDYDGFDWGAATTPFRLDFLPSGSFSNLSAYAAATGLEKHGVHIDRSTCFTSFNIPGAYPTLVPRQMMTLKTGCAAIDAGQVLPNITDGFTGSAPDMGAFEFGAATPQIGPRY